MSQHFTVGGYPNPDPHYISPEEENAILDAERAAEQEIEAFDICPLGISGKPGVGITVESTNRVWLCWDETVELHVWLTKLIALS